jgi:tetratricopeptide (TPR) repeat protein
VRALAQLAAFTQGTADVPCDPATLDGELAANAWLAVAAAHLERDAAAAARGALDAGIAAARASSPVLAAQLLAQRAALEEGAAEAEALWREALLLAGETPLPGLVGELRASLAMAVQQRAESDRRRLVEAVQLYHAALQAGVTRDRTPELWARVQANLGLAYVTMPMSEAGEKLRLAVAVQAFREALTVYQRDAHPAEWSSTMLNMANAMQYLPSSHQRENLMDAVQAYEELLAVRNRALDPVGYARLLANQGNALAHLGVFAPAVEKLTEAHKLLHWHGEADAAARLLEQVEAINAQLAGAGAEGA